MLAFPVAGQAKYFDSENFGNWREAEYTLRLGEVEQIPVEALTRVSVQNPSVADVVLAEEDFIEVIGKTVGETLVFVWEGGAKRAIRMSVVENEEIASVSAQLKKLLKAGGIDSVEILENVEKHKVVLIGEVAESKQEIFDMLIEPFLSKNLILNLTKAEKSEDMVRFDMTITEVSVSVTKDLGVNWQSLAAEGSSTSTSGMALAYPESLPTTDGKISDYFKIGKFNRTSPMVATFYALESRGDAEILSRPQVIVKSGEKAHLNVGGEIPVRTALAGENFNEEKVEYLGYGITLDLEPVIKEGKIDLTLDVGIKDVESTDSVTGDATFTTRDATTKLLLDDNQTIVLAGLISKRRSKTVEKVPFLADVPVLGLLFRRKYTPIPDKEMELVISLTPEIVESPSAKNEKNKGVPAEDVTAAASPAPIIVPYYPVVHTESTQDAVTVYSQGIAEKISTAMAGLKQAGLTENRETKVELFIFSDGSLGYALVKQSSGNSEFDEQAVSLVKTSAPFPSFPPSMDQKELKIVVPIAYKVNK